MSEKVLVYDMLLKDYFEYEPKELLQVILKCGGTLTKVDNGDMNFYILDNGSESIEEG